MTGQPHGDRQPGLRRLGRGDGHQGAGSQGVGQDGGHDVFDRIYHG